METTAKDLSLVPLRMSLGATMLYHGAGKLRSEEARQQAAGSFQQLGFEPPHTWAQLAGVTELFAGASAMLGIGTRLGALAVVVTQAVAIAKVHRSKGFDNLAGGYEFNLLLIAAGLALLAAGPGTVSIHEAIERRLQRGARWLLAPRRRRAVRAVKLLK